MQNPTSTAAASRVDPARAPRFADAVAAGVPNTLPGWSRQMMRFRGPQAMGATLAGLAGARLALGRFRPADARVAASLVVAQPFTEWLTHVLVLHRPPRRRGTRTVELFAARKHREHHLDPLDMELVLVQKRILIVAMPAVAAAQLLATRDRRLALTAAATSTALLLTYEWVHFLIHSPYVPRSAWYRGLWRGHRLHHYKNEKYWFGITSRLGDRVLRTNPARGAVAVSPTARTLAA